MNANEPAFPLTTKRFSDLTGASYPSTAPGLTKREWMATKAMATLANSIGGVYSCEAVAKSAVRYADALLAELNKEQK